MDIIQISPQIYDKKQSNKQLNQLLNPVEIHKKRTSTLLFPVAGKKNESPIIIRKKSYLPENLIVM
ncbi:MAG: hypothetical protein Q8K02_17070 [Flavobacterium sp.]|nr:hypothetical protein [Flavobacterium sp.]